MTDLTTLTADERRRIVDDYVDAVFGNHDSPSPPSCGSARPSCPRTRPPTKSPRGSSSSSCCAIPATSLPADGWPSAPSRRDPSPKSRSSRSARRSGEHAGTAVRAGIAPDSPEALPVVERLEAMAAGAPNGRAEAAERIEAFTDRRVARYWTLVGIVNNWPQAQTSASDALIEAWEWYARALRAYA